MSVMLNFSGFEFAAVERRPLGLSAPCGGTAKS